MSMCKELSALDRTEVLVRAGIKFLRGFRKRLFLGECHGMLFVGKHVVLSHASHIRCGRNCKFEDYS